MRQNAPLARTTYILFHEKAVWRTGTKWKNVYLINVDNMAIWLYCSLAVADTMFLLFKEQSQKEAKISETVI